MADIDPDISRRISDAARRVQVAKSMMERAKSWEERKLLEVELANAEAAMQDAAMNVNRGLSRAAPST